MYLWYSDPTIIVSLTYRLPHVFVEEWNIDYVTLFDHMYLW